jgi:hypothetical protein
VHGTHPKKEVTEVTSMRLFRRFGPALVALAGLLLPASAGAATSIEVSRNVALAPNHLLAYATVTAACEPGGVEGALVVFLHQGGGQQTTTADGFLDMSNGELLCDGVPHTYVVTLGPAYPRPLHGGPAILGGFVLSCGAGGCARADLDWTDVRLSGRR